MAHRLVYRSVPMAPPLSQIIDIMRSAERRNAELGCSGMLFYGDGTYAQVIEGRKAAVETLWSAIAADRRHRIVWRRDREVPARMVVAQLPMGYLSEREARADPAYAPIVELLARDSAGPPQGAQRAAGLGRALAEAARRKYPTTCTGAEA